MSENPLNWIESEEIRWMIRIHYNAIKSDKIILKTKEMVDYPSYEKAKSEAKNIIEAGFLAEEEYLQMPMSYYELWVCPGSILAIELFSYHI